MTPHRIDVAGAAEVRPPTAPVVSDLTGRERAGVNLTWGVLGIMAMFLVFILVILSINEWHATSVEDSFIRAANTAGIQAVETQRTSFRTFWMEITRTILLNVLLPVLTALLGYVFGTTAQRKADTE
jgi:hypothetical protein